MFQREYPEPGTLLNDLWHVTRHDEKWVWLGLYLYMCFFFFLNYSKESCYKAVLTLKPLYNMNFEGSI